MTVSTEVDILVLLKQALMKENVQSDHELSTLDPEFYQNILKAQPDEKAQSLLNTLVRKRQGKIVLLANVLKLTPELEQKLTIEERELFSAIHNSFESFRKKVMGDFNLI